MLTIDVILEWGPIYIKNEKTKYEISTTGLVKNTNTNKCLMSNIDRYGYPYVTLFHNKKRYHRTIHRLIATAFIDNIDNKPEVNHKDGIKYNTHISNLEYVTSLENIQHAIDTGLRGNNIHKGENHKNSKCCNEQIEYAAYLLSENQYTKKEISEITKVPIYTLNDMLFNNGWLEQTSKYDIHNFNKYERTYLSDDMKKDIYTLSKQGYRNVEIMDILHLPKNDKNHAIIKYYKCKEK